MQVTIEQVEPCKVAISVEVEPEAVRRAIDQAYRDIANKVSVPGFRKGRAPRHILERYVDAETIRERAVSALVPEYSQRALKEQGVEAVASPALDITTELHPDQPFRFTITVPTQPQVQLCNYRGIPVKRRPAQVTESDVQARLQFLRLRAARLEEAEAEVAGPGMVAVVDLEAYRGARPLKSRSRTDFLVHMDDSTSVPAFNTTIEGMRIGEKREMAVRYPPDYADRVLAGKEIVYHITLKALKRRVVPDLDDAFAQNVEGAENLEALRQRVRQELEAAAQEVANHNVRDQLVEYVVAHSEVHFPEVLVQERVAEEIAKVTKALQQRGATLESYLQERGLDLAAYERELREDARRRIRTHLVLNAIANQEGITVSDEEVNAEIERLAREAGVPSPSLRAMLERQDGEGLRGLQAQIRVRKVVDVLQQSAVITDE